jgi:hypothetical protein
MELWGICPPLEPMLDAWGAAATPSTGQGCRAETSLRVRRPRPRPTSDGSHGWRQSGMCVCDRQKLAQAAATGEGRRVAVDALKETNQVCAYADPHVCFCVVTCPHWVEKSN